MRLPELELDPAQGYVPREGEEVAIAIDGRGIRVLGDSGYDCHENLRVLAASGIEAALKVREDSDPNCGGKRGVDGRDAS